MRTIRTILLNIAPVVTFETKILSSFSTAQVLELGWKAFGNTHTIARLSEALLVLDSDNPHIRGVYYISRDSGAHHNSTDN